MLNNLVMKINIISQPTVFRPRDRLVVSERDCHQSTQEQEHTLPERGHFTMWNYGAKVHVDIHLIDGILSNYWQYFVERILSNYSIWTTHFAYISRLNLRRISIFSYYTTETQWYVADDSFEMICRFLPKLIYLSRNHWEIRGITAVFICIFGHVNETLTFCNCDWQFVQYDTSVYNAMQTEDYQQYFKCILP